LKADVREKFPVIVIFPQCPPDTTWSYRVEKFDSALNKKVGRYPFHQTAAYTELMVKELTDKLIASGIADKKRIYISGLSMGASGTYDLLVRFPDYYAAAITIAGESSVPLMVKNCKSLPLWIFHGAKDDIMDPKTDRDLYAQLKVINPNVKYTEYPNANHNSWDSAFAEPDLLPWLFGQHR
jgi:predicted peptidase